MSTLQYVGYARTYVHPKLTPAAAEVLQVRRVKQILVFFLTDGKGFRKGNHQLSCEDELIWGARENTICVDETLNKLIICFPATEKRTGFECCVRGIANWWFAIVNVLVFVTFYGQPCRVNLFREIKFSFCSIFGLASFSSSAIAYTS